MARSTVPSGAISYSIEHRPRRRTATAATAGSCAPSRGDRQAAARTVHAPGERALAVPSHAPGVWRLQPTSDIRARDLGNITGRPAGGDRGHVRPTLRTDLTNAPNLLHGGRGRSWSAVPKKRGGARRRLRQRRYLTWLRDLSALHGRSCGRGCPPPTRSDRWARSVRRCRVALKKPRDLPLKVRVACPMFQEAVPKLASRGGRFRGLSDSPAPWSGTAERDRGVDVFRVPVRSVERVQVGAPVWSVEQQVMACSPSERHPAQRTHQSVGVRAGVATVAVGERMDRYEPVMDPTDRLVPS